MRSRDDLCKEMVQFANASLGGAEYSVRFTSDWGGVFSEEEDVFAEKRCEHDGFGPGKKLCSYLMENTSTEFARININRALRCLGAPETRKSRGGDFKPVAAKVTATDIRGLVQGMKLGIEYAYGFEGRPPLLRIFAGSA